MNLSFPVRLCAERIFALAYVSRTRGCETHSKTIRLSSGKIVYDPATEPGGAHQRWLRETPDHRCCLRGLVCCLRHSQPPTPPRQGARYDWRRKGKCSFFYIAQYPVRWTAQSASHFFSRRTPGRPDKHHTGKQTLLCGAELEEEPLTTTTTRTTTGKCIGTDVVQHLHQQTTRTRRHSQLHLRRRRVHRVAWKRLQQHRIVTHVCPDHCDHLLRHEPTAYTPLKDTVVCFPPKEPRSQTEFSVERYQTLTHNNTSVSGRPP